MFIAVSCSTLTSSHLPFHSQTLVFPHQSPQVLRLGNSADALESAKRAVHLSDVVLRFCITVSHLNRALYFACDNVLWAGKSGLAPRVDQEKWAQRSFRFDILLLSYKTFCSLPPAWLPVYEGNIFSQNCPRMCMSITWLPVFISSLNNQRGNSSKWLQFGWDEILHHFNFCLYHRLYLSLPPTHSVMQPKNIWCFLWKSSKELMRYGVCAKERSSLPRESDIKSHLYRF